MKIFILKIKYSGLGDHLLCSHLPRIAKQFCDYDEVYVSNHSPYRNFQTKELVWEMNPFVDGFCDEDRKWLQVGSVTKEMNILDKVMLFHGLDDGIRFHEPEIYYKPKKISKLGESVIFEPNHRNKYGIPSLKLVEKYFAENIVKWTHQMKPLYGNSPIEGLPIIDANRLKSFCDVIHSCKAFFCFTSGAATLSAGLGKPTTVLYVDGINPRFHHSKLHNYIRL